MKILLATMDQQNNDYSAINTLSSTNFCGPNRSIPVNDLSRATIAKELLDFFCGTNQDKRRISNAIDRKMDIYRTDNPNNKSEKEESNMATKLTFDSLDELIDSAEVKKAIDEAVTAVEQKLDDTKKAADENESKFKAIAIDAIIDLSSQLDKAYMRDLAGKEGKDLEAAMDAVKQRFLGRSLDTIICNLGDLREEMTVKKATDSEDQENDDQSQSAVESAANNGVENNADSEAGDKHDSAASSDSEDTTAGEETNQADSSESSDKSNVVNPMSSFTKPVNQ